MLRNGVFYRAPHRKNHQHRYWIFTTPKTSTTQQLAESIFDDMLQLSKTDAKWNRGHVAILAKKGAAVLAARECIGLWSWPRDAVGRKEDLPYLIGLRPEIILATPDQLDPKRHDALIVGPALGFSKQELVEDCGIPFPILPFLMRMHCRRFSIR